MGVVDDDVGRVFCLFGKCPALDENNGRLFTGSRDGGIAVGHAL